MSIEETTTIDLFNDITAHLADPTVTGAQAADADPSNDWRRTAVVYQVYPRSFADSDGDGVGDLPGITNRLGALAELGVDAVWLSPFYKSPQADAGYDVADYRDVDPVFGTLADFDAMLERENSVSTFVGEGVAIPHGTLAGKDAVKDDAIVVLRFPDGVDWDGNEVSVAVGIAAKGNGHIALLSQLATVLLDPDKAAALRGATTSDRVYELLASDEDDE